ncbi:agmatine deiminase family protein [Yinghuangia seranimata]|uniref:agmatine deiminase family protein n=1 Tax=Yinghuangia seranimata TaxID=408067 RepID=UPI00248BFE16|nr:agmatine deiminase family protein [Yinghuangia seranimata]MDI2124578.1 agmatine deiminase family protein [Yinghuangia seranimata]
MVGVGAVAVGLAGCSDSSGTDGEAGPETSGTSAPGTSGSPSTRRFGAEWDSHARTFMSWPASTGIWGPDLAAVRRDITGIARAIAATEPVVLLARPEQADDAQNACGSDVEVVPIPVDDLWARDTVPVFVEEAGAVHGVDFNFNGWGDKQAHGHDALVAREVLAKYGIPRDQTWITAEGGSFETDGAGTLMVTESSVVNDNRNPGKSRQQIEDELKRVLGVTKVIWFEGVRGKDITDAHVDSLARFVAPGVVLLDKAFPGEPADSWSRSADQARAVLKDATDARGKTLQVIDLPQPDPQEMTGHGDDFVSSYVNFFIGNKAVFLPRFGDKAADDRARGILRDHFPDRDVVSLRIDTIASGGGGIHCATHDQPGTPAP